MIYRNISLFFPHRTDYGAIQSGWQISRSESIRPKLSYSRDRDTIKPIIKYFVTRRGGIEHGRCNTKTNKEGMRQVKEMEGRGRQRERERERE